ncbi:helix-turn-helix domain-containing protein [Nocardioides pantholopis]|uniref:helix-turn-helix domain-containing protein n=1 Tax=Nocardioides pantholopis TaxID=2483798 RepID=UPI000FDBECCE|nr:helix-turn-helix domain-containing protein [Nocardioides pantholopis]
MPDHFIPPSSAWGAAGAAPLDRRANGPGAEGPPAEPTNGTRPDRPAVSRRSAPETPPAPEDPFAQYSIHQLAAATHLSVRTIRAYQTRGLLAPPRRQGRRVVYGRRHLDRLEKIKTLQREGYNLAAIAAHFLPSRVTMQNQAALRLLRRSAAEHPVVVANLLKHGVVVITQSGNIEIAEESPVLAAFELKHLGFEVSDCVCVLAEVIDAFVTAMPGVLKSLDQTSRGPGLLALAMDGHDGDPRATEVSARVLTEAFRVSLLACAVPRPGGSEESVEPGEAAADESQPVRSLP